MPTIVHRVGVKASIARVHGCFSTLPGLREFWSEGATGDPGAGGQLKFYFAGERPSAVMTVTEVSPTLITWHCDEGPREWVNTTVRFELREQINECSLYFQHDGWSQVTEFMGHCSTKWAYFLLGLKWHLEGAASVAYPNDVAISAWEEPLD